MRRDWLRLNGKISWKVDTVDGSDIWHSPLELGSLSHYLQGFLVSRISEPSTAVHERYQVIKDVSK